MASEGAPVVLVPPVKKTVFEGEEAMFAVTASGTAPLTYQWQREGIDLEGETNMTLLIAGVELGDAGGYRVVVMNSMGSAASSEAVLVVRLAGDPRYPAPQGGWAYLLGGDLAGGSAAAALDGSWNHDNASDSWAGDGRGVGVGLPGGIGTVDGILTVEDSVTMGNTSVDNRRYYLTRELDGDGGIPASGTLLDDGVTLSFRARLTPADDALVELADAPNGWANLSGGKGMVGIRQSGGGGMIVSFSLNMEVEDTGVGVTRDFGNAGLHMNTLNGDVRSGFVDPGSGTANLLVLDPTEFHEFWILIAGNGSTSGTHRVSVYVDGSRTPAVFDVTAGTGTDGAATNYLALGLSGTPQTGAFDLDFLGYKPGLILPVGFDEPVEFISQPVGGVVLVGETIEFGAVVEGTPQITFQWYRDGVPVMGATHATYETPALTLEDHGGGYTLVASNGCGSVTSAPPAVVTILVPPVVTLQPMDVTATNGGIVSFEVAVSSAGPVDYQWRREGVPVEGATAAVLVLNPALLPALGGYDVVASNRAGAVTSQVAVLTLEQEDFGDAPDFLYPTLLGENGPRHLIVPGFHLGLLVDGELDGQPVFTSGGDEADGGADEDGVFAGLLLIGEQEWIEVVASGHGLLNAWIDFDLDFSWAEPGDQIATNLALVPGTNLVSLRVPVTSRSGGVFSRFRFGSTPDLGVTGPAADGEVEDWILNLTPVADLSVQHGGGPSPVAVGSNLVYSVMVSNAGPSLATAVLLRDTLPAGVTFVSGSSPVGGCSLNGGVVTCNLNNLVVGAGVRVTIEVTPQISGVLSNHVEVVLSEFEPDLSDNSASLLVTVQEPPVITAQPAGTTITNGTDVIFSVTVTGEPPLGYQWRRDGLVLPGGTGASLQVSDAQEGDGGAYAVLITNGVGAVLSSEAILTVLVPARIEVPVAGLAVLAGGEAVFSVVAGGTGPLIYRWYFNGTNQLMGQTGSTLVLEEVQLPDAGSYHVEVSNAAGAVVGDPVELTVREVDFGDAPDTGYPTALVADGGRHRVVPGVFMGWLIDPEPDGLSDPAALGDDGDGLADEDGVGLLSPLAVGELGRWEVVVSTNGFLNGWIDFNRDGDWADGGEHLLVDVGVVGGTNVVTGPVPLEAALGTTHGRFRFATTGGLGVAGEAMDGEVEDYQMVVLGAVDLGVETLAPSLVAAGSNVIYTVTVTNRGPSEATAVAVANLLVGVGDLVLAGASQGSCVVQSGSAVCNLGTLGAGGSATVTVTALATSAGLLTHTVTVGSGEFEVESLDNEVVTGTGVLEFPSVLVPPSGQTVSNGMPVTFEATVAGSALGFQWRLDGVDLAGATGLSLMIGAVTLADTGSYTLLVSNAVGSVVSEAAQLLVLALPEITEQPAGLEAVAGSNVTLSVRATGTEPLSYYWRFNGVVVAGGGGPALTLPAVGLADEGVYSVVVSNQVGVAASGAAVLSVVFPPMITAQPQPLTVVAGRPAELASSAVGTLPLGYQWYFNGTLLAGETGTELSFGVAVPGDGGAYTIVVSNRVGVVTSEVAVLTVEALDYGDAPDPSYPTLELFDGASHLIVEGFHLGSGVDYEPDGQPSALSDADDADGNDDEDGVGFPFPVRVGQVGTVDIEASAAGFIDGWIDFGQTGLWGDPGDRIFSGAAVTAGMNRLQFPVPAIAAAGQTKGRFRFSSAGGYSFDGRAADGEVEDHLVTVEPSFDLALTSSGIAPSVFIGGEFVYSLQVTNLRGLTATGVRLVSVLPRNLDFVSVYSSQGSCVESAGVITCNVGVLVGGSGAAIGITVNPVQGGGATHRVTLSANEHDPMTSNNEVSEVTEVLAIVGSLSNANPISLMSTGAAGLYPSTLTVSGVDSIVEGVTVTLSNLSHTFPDDLDVLLVGPAGQSVVLMSDAGGGGVLENVTLRFSDLAPLPLSDSGQLIEGSVRPSNFGAEPDLFPAPAPAPPYGAALAVFRGTDPNGVWSLYVVDDLEDDAGMINDGWTLDIVTLGPLADLGVGQLAIPSPVAIGSNLTYVVTVTNRGPAQATEVELEDVLPSTARLVSAVPSQGVCMEVDGVMTCLLGSLAPGGTAVVEIVVETMALGGVTNRTRVAAAELDLDLSNNLLDTVVAVKPSTDLSLAFVEVPDRVNVGGGIRYVIGVTNRSADPATEVELGSPLPAGTEFVSVSTVDGVCSNDTGVVRCYWDVLAGGAGVEVVVELLPLRIGLMGHVARAGSAEVDRDERDNTAGAVTEVVTVLGLLAAGGPIAIPAEGMAVPYPSQLMVGGVTGTVAGVSVVLSNLSHPFPDDLDILLEGPGGQTVMLMSDNGGGSGVEGVTLWFREEAVLALPDGVGIVSGEYRPSNAETMADGFLPPAPAGPYGTGLPVFERTDPNGVWSLYVMDDQAFNPGMISGGWGLELTLLEPLADLGVSQAASPDPVAVGGELSHFVVVTNRGPGTAYDVILAGDLPSPVGSFSSSQGSCEVAGGVLTCVIGVLPAGASAEVLLVLVPAMEGTLTNRVSVSAASRDLLEGDNSAEAITVVRRSPVVIRRPESQLAISGDEVVFTVEVGGSPPFRYQWLYENVEIPDATNSALTLTGVVAAQSGGYSVRVSNDVGVALSGQGELVVRVRPLISAIADQTISEDGLAGPLLFTVQDFETRAFDLELAVSSSDTNLVPLANVIVTGVETNRTLVVFPGADRFGVATLTLTVTDDDGLESAESFELTVTEVNDPPVITGLGGLEVSRDAARMVSFGVGDVETSAGALVVSGVSSDGSVIPTSGLTFGGSGTNRTLTLVPGAGQVGVTTVTVTVTDSGNVSSMVSFEVVVAPNTPPFSSAISPQGTVEDVPTGLISFMVGDDESDASRLVVTAGSSNPVLMPGGSILIGGAGATRTLRLFPGPNRSGSVTVFVIVTDPGGFSSTNAFFMTVVSVNDPPILSFIAGASVVQDSSISLPLAIRDVETPSAALTLSGRSSNPALLADGSILFGGAGGSRTVTLIPEAGEVGLVTISIRLADAEGVAVTNHFQLEVLEWEQEPVITSQPVDQSVEEWESALLSVVAVGPGPLSYQWRLNGLELAGATNALHRIDPVRPGDAGEYTVTVDNAFGEAEGGPARLEVVRTIAAPPSPTLIALGSVWRYLDTGVAPDIGWRGLGFDDAGWGAGPAELGYGDFPVEATVVSYGPSVANKFITTWFRRTIVVENPGGYQDLTLGVQRDDGAVVYLNGEEVFRSNMPEGPIAASTRALSNVADAGETDLQFTSVDPALLVRGENVVAVEIHQVNSTSADLSFDLEFTGTVAPGLHISDILNQATAEGIPLVAGFEISAENTPPPGLELEGATSDPGLLPGSNIVFMGSGTNRTVRLTPVAGESGRVMVTITVRNGEQSASDSFWLTVGEVNDPPRISDIPDHVTLEDSVPVGIPFSVGDDRTAVGELLVSVASSQPAILNPANIVVTGLGTNRTLTLTPGTNMFGTVILSVTVLDEHGVPAVDHFLLNVGSVNDAPGLDPLPDLILFPEVRTRLVTVSGIHDGRAGEGQQLALVAESSNTALLPHPTVDYFSPDFSGELTLEPVPGVIGVTTVTLTLSDGQSMNNPAIRSFQVRVSEPAGIVAQPQGRTVPVGGGFTLSVSGKGTGPLSYQWRLNGVALPGATARLFSVVNSDAGDAGDYTVLVSNAAGSELSSPARVRVLVPPAITGLEVVPGAGVRVFFSTVSGLVYTLEYRGSVEAGAWTGVGGVVGDGAGKSLMDPAPAAVFRVYRVRGD